jgi:hypothetical protein
MTSSSSSSSSNSSASDVGIGRRNLRPNRGNKLSQLLRDGFSDEDDIDDAWKEQAGDSDFEASSDSTQTSDDSDFSASESEGRLSSADGDANTEQAVRREERDGKEQERKSFMKRKDQKQPLQGAVRQRKASGITQADRMTAAAATALSNTRALEHEEAALVQQSAARTAGVNKVIRRRRSAPAADATAQRARYVSTPATIRDAGAAHVIVMPGGELPPSLEPTAKPEPLRCCISGKPAKYVDPVTRQPYADLAAFRTLRKRHRTA